jgi:dTDP-4-dehydrorhamnose reductase
MKIFVFGHTGMLGSYLSKYFDSSIGVGRDRVDACIKDWKIIWGQLRDLHMVSGDVVLNAIGLTNKANAPIGDFLMVNSIFPRLLADYCESYGIHMIHISTDCVFSGKHEDYKEDDIPDATDTYGLSKSLGEPRNCSVIRTSVIGENNRSKADLLEWVRGQMFCEIKGYTNHYWNGITCLQYAEVCEKIINTNGYWKGVRHIFSPRGVSKRDLVEIINDVYGCHNTITPVETPTWKINTLSSWYHQDTLPDITEQIIKQKDYLK